MSTPSVLFRNAIDLNRYSNSVARQIIVSYNDIILDSVDQLQRLIPNVTEGELQPITAPAKAARLRSILAQLKDSLDTWAGDSSLLIASELQGLAELQSEFVQGQLEQALPAGSRTAVNTVEISPQFAQSVVMTDPTEIGVVSLSDDLVAAVQGSPQRFSLTAAQGTAITLPNGRVVEKTFRGIAEQQAERFSQVIRQGLLTGESTQEIASRLVGRLERTGDIELEFGQRARSVKQLQLAGGELTKAAGHQVLTLVRTSVNQVANAASQQVYEANQDITKRYRYVATLDTRTSAICRALDGREFEYGKGPKPPQHFNCRSTTVPVIEQEEGETPLPVGRRAAQGGMVPANQSYGEWLSKQSKSRQIEALGESRVPYFKSLSRKYGPRDAIAKLVRDDGSELTLADLRKRYGRIN
jgi:SPP1 gp7 family putative phage head morphogenesis protein